MLLRALRAERPRRVLPVSVLAAADYLERQLQRVRPLPRRIVRRLLRRWLRNPRPRRAVSMAARLLELRPRLRRNLLRRMGQRSA
jgi:hypothetical protein